MNPAAHPHPNYMGVLLPPPPPLSPWDINPFGSGLLSFLKLFNPFSPSQLISMQILPMLSTQNTVIYPRWKIKFFQPVHKETIETV